MKNSKLLLYALLNSIGVFLYTSAVAWLLFNGERFFGKAENFLMPAGLLLLFVLSATVVGALVLARPIILYLDNLKTEAVKMLVYTIIFLVIITFIILLANAISGPVS